MMRLRPQDPFMLELRGRGHGLRIEVGGVDGCKRASAIIRRITPLALQRDILIGL